MAGISCDEEARRAKFDQGDVVAAVGNGIIGGVLGEGGTEHADAAGEELR